MSRSVRGRIVERLPLILGNPTRRRLTALATALAESGDPYGPKAEVHCSHSSHGYRGKIVGRCKGYQQWLLENVAWVPVEGDPAGERFRTPGEAWILGRRESELLLPRLALPSGTRSAFSFPTSH